MQIAVFDTYVRRPDGRRMHFDILVPNSCTDQATVMRFGQAYLSSKNIPANTLVSEECRFCHFESASAEVEQDILSAGYSILEMQNCD